MRHNLLSSQATPQYTFNRASIVHIESPGRLIFHASFPGMPTYIVCLIRYTSFSVLCGELVVIVDLNLRSHRCHTLVEYKARYREYSSPVTPVPPTLLRWPPRRSIVAPWVAWVRARCMPDRRVTWRASRILRDSSTVRVPATALVSATAALIPKLMVSPAAPTAPADLAQSARTEPSDRPPTRRVGGTIWPISS